MPPDPQLAEAARRLRILAGMLDRVCHDVAATAYHVEQAKLRDDVQILEAMETQLREYEQWAENLRASIYDQGA